MESASAPQSGRAHINVAVLFVAPASVVFVRQIYRIDRSGQYVRCV